MNKNEFIAAVADNANLQKHALSKGVVGDLVEAFLDTIRQALKDGDEIRLVGFGNFYVSSRPASVGRNPHTGEPLNIKASKQPKFKAGKQLKEEVNTEA